MIEAVIGIVIPSVLGATVFSAGVVAVIQFFTSLNMRKTETRKTYVLSQAQRDEIEQNEAWWFRSFHDLLLKSGAPVSKRIPGVGFEHMRYGYPEWIVPEDRVSLEGCMCPRCENVVAEAKRRDAAPKETAPRHPTHIRDIQKALGVQADGIVGPATLRAMNPSRITAESITADRIYVAHEQCNHVWDSYTTHQCRLPKGHAVPHRCGEHPESWIAVGVESYRTPAYSVLDL